MEHKHLFDAQPCGRFTEYLPIVAVAITQEIPRSRVPREGLQQLLGRNQENLGMMALQPGENPPVDAKCIIFRTVLMGFGGRQNDLMVLVPLNKQDTVTNLSSTSRI